MIKERIKEKIRPYGLSEALCNALVLQMESLFEQEKARLFEGLKAKYLQEHSYVDLPVLSTELGLGMGVAGWLVFVPEDAPFGQALKSKGVVCRFCGGSGEVLEEKARQGGYTPGINIPYDPQEEKLIPCPACKAKS